MKKIFLRRLEPEVGSRVHSPLADPREHECGNTYA